MDISDAKQILEQMYEGVDPISGEILPSNHICNYPVVIRALRCVLDALDTNASREKRQKTKANTSPEWQAWEDETLTDNYHGEEDIYELAKTLGRRQHAVKCRLVYLGIEKMEILGRPSYKGLEHYGLPWYPEDIAQIKALFDGGGNIDDIAKKLMRSKHSIAMQLVKMGLIDDINQVE